MKKENKMKTRMENKIAISVGEAAEMIGISRTKMYEIIKRKDVDFVVELDGRRLIMIKKFEEWLERQAGVYSGDISVGKYKKP